MCISLYKEHHCYWHKCDGYYAITKKEKAILVELQSLVPILVSHWEKTIIEEAKWKTYLANKAEFIEREIENINREINKLDEGRKQAIDDREYLNNKNPSYKCAEKRYKLKERMLQLQYLKRKTSSVALKDKADLNINHVPQLEKQEKPENSISSNTQVLQGSLDLVNTPSTEKLLEEDSSKSQEIQSNSHSAETASLPAEETPVLISSNPNLGSDSQEDELETSQLNTPHIIVTGDDCTKIVAQDHVPGDECAKIVAQDHVPGDECAIISGVPVAPPAYSLGETELRWLLSFNQNKENVSLASPPIESTHSLNNAENSSETKKEEKPIEEEHEKSLEESQSNHPSLEFADSTLQGCGLVSNIQNDNPVIHMPALGASSISPLAGSAADSDNALIHLASTLADLYSSIRSHPPVQNNPPLAVENAGTEVSPSNPTLQKKSLTFFQDSKPTKHFYDEPKVLTNMLSSYFELAIQFRLGLTLIEHKEHLIVIIYTNKVEDGLFLMDTPTLKDLRDIDLLTISKKNGNVPILIKVKDSNHYFIFGCLGNKPWKITRLWGEKSDIFIKLLDQTEENRVVNRNKLSQDVWSALKKYHSFFIHFPQPTYNFFFDEKHVLQILNTRKLQTHPGEINIKRGGSLEASLLQLIYNIANKKGVPPPMISSNLNNNTRSEVTAPAYHR